MHRALLLFQVNLRNIDISVGKCKQLPTLNSQEQTTKLHRMRSAKCIVSGFVFGFPLSEISHRTNKHILYVTMYVTCLATINTLHIPRQPSPNTLISIYPALKLLFMQFMLFLLSFTTCPLFPSSVSNTPSNTL